LSHSVSCDSVFDKGARRPLGYASHQRVRTPELWNRSMPLGSKTLGLAGYSQILSASCR
jgi:hypothetical protein